MKDTLEIIAMTYLGTTAIQSIIYLINRRILKNKIEKMETLFDFFKEMR